MGKGFLRRGWLVCLSAVLVASLSWPAVGAAKMAESGDAPFDLEMMNDVSGSAPAESSDAAVSGAADEASADNGTDSAAGVKPSGEAGLPLSRAMMMAAKVPTESWTQPMKTRSWNKIRVPRKMRTIVMRR